jgi:dTMP kinase
LPREFKARDETGTVRYDAAMLIAIEGIDGAGKNTQTTLLKAKALAAGLSIAGMSFPNYGKTLFSASIADYLNGKLGDLHSVAPQFAALLYAGDRLETLPLIKQLNAAHDLLVCDRYVPSNLAYQGAKVPADRRQAFVDWITRIEYEVYGVPRADLNIFLDVPVATAVELIARKKPRSYTEKAADLHEADTAYLNACRGVYVDLAQQQTGGKWVIIPCVNADGTMRDAEAISAGLWSAIQEARRIART